MKNRLSELRTKKGYSMRQAAKLMGLPYTTYVNYEKGDRDPNSEMLVFLADFYGVTVDYLIGKDEAPAEGDELEQLLETLKNRPDMRLLFNLASNATVDDVMRAVRIIEALGKEE
jgi:transcriptional regulator with XRE-family HTH domain